MLIRDLKRKKDFLICIDSDGCLLDNMELKHKECFCPAFINCWNLQAGSRYAREVWEFVNLYSSTRGTNRFPALVRALGLVSERKEIRQRGIQPFEVSDLRDWCEKTDNFSESALASYIASFTGKVPDDLENALRWSKEVNANILHTVRNIGPFPGVIEAIEAMSEYADVAVVSSTPQEALIRELNNCRILECFDAVAGQESGTKEVCVRTLIEKGGYEPDHVLKVGDAPGDYKAAMANGCLYYPIIPGHESDSWDRLRETVLSLFIDGTYRGRQMDEYIKEFFSILPDNPLWQNE